MPFYNHHLTCSWTCSGVTKSIITKVVGRLRLSSSGSLHEGASACPDNSHNPNPLLSQGCSALFVEYWCFCQPSLALYTGKLHKAGSPADCILRLARLAWTAERADMQEACFLTTTTSRDCQGSSWTKENKHHDWGALDLNSSGQVNRSCSRASLSRSLSPLSLSSLSLLSLSLSLALSLSLSLSHVPPFCQLLLCFINWHLHCLNSWRMHWIDICKVFLLTLQSHESQQLQHRSIGTKPGHANSLSIMRSAQGDGGLINLRVQVLAPGFPPEWEALFKTNEAFYCGIQYHQQVGGKSLIAYSLVVKHGIKPGRSDSRFVLKCAAKCGCHTHMPVLCSSP